MKNLLKYLFSIFSVIICNESTWAQDVYVEIPTSYIFNRSEYITIKNVMNTQNHTHWRAGPLNPKIKSNSGDYFRHTTLPGKLLPTSILHWRLQSMGGKTPPFYHSDSWPDYKWFASWYQTWYHPSVFSTYRSGGIDFTFKVPQNQIANNAFHAGKYKIEIEQDYGRSGFYTIEFSPQYFNTYISIAEDIKWLLFNDHKFHDITSLNQFREGSSPVLINLGPMQIGHTVDFKLFAKSDERNVKFQSLNGDIRKFDISVMTLGSNNTKFTTAPLGDSWKNYTPNGSFIVDIGNRSSFELLLSISSEDFKNHFFEAGTYTFQLELESRSSNDALRSQKNIDVSINVPALSEISLPRGHTDVNFTFNTMVKYNEGQAQTISNQIRISNNKNYELYVKSSESYFSSNGIQTDLKAAVLEVNVDGNPQKVALSTHPQKILNNGTPVLDKNLNMTYSISPEAAQSLISKEKKSYGINVIYGFTAL